MKLQEFMNDDTCQILFAIIIGIVVCYFIFGSCGSSGSCNRDGFSVGGPCTGGATEEGRICENMGETACIRNGRDCSWRSPAPAPAPAGGTTDPVQMCDQFILDLDASMPDGTGSQSDCDSQQPSVAGARQECCFGEFPRTDGGITLMTPDNPNYRACSDASLTTLKTGLDLFRTTCRSNFPTGDPRVQTAPAGAGGTDPAGTALIGTPGQVLLIQNIKRDIEYQVSRITGEDPGSLNFASINETRLHLENDRWAGTRTISDAFKRINFDVLVNDKNIDGSENQDKIYLRTNPDQIFDLYQGGLQDLNRLHDLNKYFLSRKIDTHATTDSNSQLVVASRASVLEPQDTKNIHEMGYTYGQLTLNNQKAIYCNDYTLRDDSGTEYIDPLLKIISDGMIQDPTCPGGAMDFGTLNNNYQIQPSQTDTNNMAEKDFIPVIMKKIAINKGIPNADASMGFVSPTTHVYSSLNPELLYSDLDVPRQINNDGKIPIPIIFPGMTHRNGKIGTSHWEPEIVIGMSGLGITNENSNPYHRNTPIDESNINNTADQIYLKNLLWFQYYFARLFFGSDTYVPFNAFRNISGDAQKINITQDNTSTEETHYVHGDGSEFPDFSKIIIPNAACQQSGDDYLLITTMTKNDYNYATPFTAEDATRFNSNDPNIREANGPGIFIVDGIFKKITDVDVYNSVINAAGAAGAAPAATSQFTQGANGRISLQDQDRDRYLLGGGVFANGAMACSSIFPLEYTLSGTGLPAWGTGSSVGRVAGDDSCGFCLDNFCADNSKVPEIISRLTPAPEPTSQITNSSFYSGDNVRYVPDGIGVDNICSTDNPYTLPNTGPSDDVTLNLRGDNCAFCLSGYCADNSKVPEIISRLTLKPEPLPRCNSKRFLFDTGKGCEWLNTHNGEYDHKSCGEFVARSAGPGYGYMCETGTEVGREGESQCKNGTRCAGPLPTQSGKVGHDGL